MLKQQEDNLDMKRHRRTSLTWVDNKQQEMWCCQQSSVEAPLQKMRKAYLTRILWYLQILDRQDSFSGQACAWVIQLGDGDPTDPLRHLVFHSYLKCLEPELFCNIRIKLIPIHIREDIIC